MQLFILKFCLAWWRLVFQPNISNYIHAIKVTKLNLNLTFYLNIGTVLIECDYLTNKSIYLSAAKLWIEVHKDYKISQEFLLKCLAKYLVCSDWSFVFVLRGSN